MGELDRVLKVGKRLVLARNEISISSTPDLHEGWDELEEPDSCGSSAPSIASSLWRAAFL